ncbi:MAG: hypothetical protein ACI9Y7_002923 [Dokdonia sp.]|jgi:hypothetical protein
MKKYILVFAFAMCTLSVLAQSQTTTIDVKVGDLFEIGAPESKTYQHINLPKPHTVRKRGGIHHDTDLKGSVVIITAVKKKKDGSVLVKIKRKDGKRFFRTHKVIKADFTNAVQSGELQAK